MYENLDQDITEKNILIDYDEEQCKNTTSKMILGMMISTSNLPYWSCELHTCMVNIMNQLMLKKKLDTFH